MRRRVYLGAKLPRWKICDCKMDCMKKEGVEKEDSSACPHDPEGPSYRQTRLPLVLASTTSGLLETKNSPPKNSPPRDSPPKDSSPGASSIQPTSKSTASMTPPTSTALLTPPTTDCTGLGVVVTPGSGRLVLVTATPFNTIPVTAGATPVKMAAPTNTSPVGAASLGSASKTKLAKKEREIQKAERERVKTEMKAKREEEQLKKEHEKQLQEQEKKEKQLRREQELKERQEKREREELEKKERKEKREAEKRKRDEEKQKKLEEKRKLEQEKEQQKEDQLRREKQAKLKFRGYFGKVEKPAVKKEEVSGETMLTAFSIKDGMSLAKAPREPLQSTSEFDRLVLVQNPDFTSDYIHTCESVSRKVSPKQIEAAVEDDSVIIVSNLAKRSLPKFKLLQFKENHRPAYYGSWRRARGAVTPRNPLKKDKGILDYEVDSDDEWEEEEPGENISSSEGEEKEGEAEGEDSDEDDGFFVPHGYLSNDEGDCSDSGDAIPGPGEDLSEDKRSRKLAKAWEVEFARKCQPLQPKAIGCIWLQLPGDVRELSSEESFLMQFAAVPLVSLPISLAPVATQGEASTEGQGGNAEAVKQLVPEEAMPDLIRFIHKSTFGVHRIIKTFRTHWGAKISMDPPQETPPSQPSSQTNSTLHPQPGKIDTTPKSTNQHKIDTTPTSTSCHEDYENASKISKRQLEKKIQGIAVKEIRPPISKAVWYVHDNVLKQYGLEKENLTSLVPSGSPFLSTRSAEQATAKSFTPERPKQKISKRKAGKSLLDFLSRSPADKSQMFSPPKRLKVDPSTSPAVKHNDVLILDPPDSMLRDGPPTKRPCLNTASISDDHKNKGSVKNATSTVDQDIIILDLPDSTSDVLTKASQVTGSDNHSNGGGITHDNSVASGIQCL